MKLSRLWGFVPIFCLLALPVGADNSLSVGTVNAQFGTIAEVPIWLDTTDEVQGLVVVVEWDSAGGVLVGSSLADFLTTANNASDDAGTADTVVVGEADGHYVLGVVMDSNGSLAEVIPAGNHLLATLEIQCAGGSGEAVVNAVSFVDGAHATVTGGPALGNLVVVGGLSVTADEGLALNDGAFNCTPKPNEFKIADGAANDATGDGSADVVIDAVNDIEGYVIALCHDAADVTLVDIAVGVDAADAEFVATDLIAGSGGTIGVVLDFESPFSGQTLGVGQHVIASYTYECVNTPGPVDDPIVTSLSFCDMVLGSPLKDNVVVFGGLSQNAADGLKLTDGTFTCRFAGEPPAEDCNNGLDDDGDDLIDGDDDECKTKFSCTVEGSPNIGSGIDVNLELFSPEDGVQGHTQLDHIQGFSMAVSYCCELDLEGIDISGTIIETLGAEFVSLQIDADDADVDGDGCEAIYGVLVDAVPPFDGTEIPPHPDAWNVGTLSFTISDEAACGSVCWINFVDGLNGNGTVPVKNLVSSANMSRGPQTSGCSIAFEGDPVFHRGDCNMTEVEMGAMSVDISDAAAVVSYLFLPGSWKFNPICLDACDCNNDDRIDLADAICVLQFYLQGGVYPPDPGPGIDTDGNAVPRGTDPWDGDDKIPCDMQGCPAE